MSTRYLLKCKRCPVWDYSGNTERMFADRLTDHREYINRGEIHQPAGHHFNLPGHSIADLVAFAIEKVIPPRGLPRNDPVTRQNRESLWISRYDSTTYGGNVRE